ncbi:hypothetical protein AB3329_08005 [Streptococcus sp. H31]|uniref:hypothetical protein n=1 Tax=Streptococcus huangxiaojuni TaxID=3237239 RepID=UPI0034A58E8F
MTLQEASRVTPAQFAIYSKAFKIERQEDEFRCALSAWFSQTVQATKGNGKNVRPAYQKFSDFYDEKTKFAAIFDKEQTSKRLSLADKNRLLNKQRKGGINGRF